MDKNWNPTVLLLAVVLSVTLEARGDFYHWVDERGQSHVTTDPPPKKSVPQKVTLSEHVRPASPPRSTAKKLHDAGVIVGPSPVYRPKPAAPSKPPSNTPLPFLQPAASPTVEIYSADWCGVCTKTKAYFRSKGVAFTEYNVDTDSAASARARVLYPQGGIPVTVINGQTIVGFRPSQFDSALGSH